MPLHVVICQYGTSAERHRFSEVLARELIDPNGLGRIITLSEAVFLVSTERSTSELVTLMHQAVPAPSEGGVTVLEVSEARSTDHAIDQ